ncbi:MAG: beta-propeller fold lactonase family protein [Terracidiphilus sp.]|jgi:6-phosphogluconolactonase (cycloisomerase 2 family)
MKFSKLSQLFLVSAIGLVLATLLTACQLVTIDYVFVACSAGNSTGSAGQIYTYAVDAKSGAVRTASPVVSSGGTGPIAMAATSDYWHLYVANQGNKSVVHFTISDHGVLTSKDTITLSTTPVSLAVNQANTYLYVVSGTSSATLTEYPLSSGTIGAATATVNLSLAGYAGDTLVPTGVTALANSSAVYVTAVDKSAYNPGGSTTSNANPGWLFGYTVGSGGALTPVTGSPYQAGVKPSALASDPNNRFVYVTDFASNEMIGYTVLSTDVLQFMVNGPFRTGGEPSSIAIDPRGLYIYVSDSLDSAISAYSISLATGTPTAAVSATGSAINSTDTDPVSIIVEPAEGRFVYTANYLGNSVSGFRLDPDTGVVEKTQATPYPTGAVPAALIAVPHGNHSTQNPIN